MSLSMNNWCHVSTCRWVSHEGSSLSHHGPSTSSFLSFFLLLFFSFSKLRLHSSLLGQDSSICLLLETLPPFSFLVYVWNLTFFFLSFVVGDFTYSSERFREANQEQAGRMHLASISLYLVISFTYSHIMYAASINQFKLSLMLLE